MSPVRSRWYSTPNALRRSPIRRFTLDPLALSALAYLAPEDGLASARVREALVALARVRGWAPEEKEVETQTKA